MTDDMCSILSIVSQRQDELDRLESSLKKKYHSNLIAGRSKQDIIDDAKAQLVTALVTVTSDIHTLGSNLNDYISAQEDVAAALGSKIDVLTDRINAIKHQKTEDSLNSWRLERNANKDNTAYYEDVKDLEKYDNNYVIDRVSISERLQKLDTPPVDAIDDLSLSTRHKIVFKAVERKPLIDNKLLI